MKTLLNIFREKIIELDNEEEDVSENSYSTEKLKKKLVCHFGNSISFHKPSNVLMPETVFGSSIEVKDIINLASSFKERIRLRNISEDLSGNLSDAGNISEESTLYYASVIIRKALEGVESIQYRHVNPRDILIEKAESFIPDRLYTFIIGFSQQNKLLPTKQYSGLMSKRITILAEIYSFSRSRYAIYEKYGRRENTKTYGCEYNLP